MDGPTPAMNPATSSSASARHAYHTADYKVTKREMASLWNRYYVWKAAKDHDMRREESSVYNMDGGNSSRRAYQTASFEVTTIPVRRSSSHLVGRHATQGSLKHGPVHKTVSDHQPAEAAEATQ